MQALRNIQSAELELTIDNAECLARELFEIATMRRQLEKREAKLKTFFKNVMKDDITMRVGAYMMTLKDCVTTSFDREGLLAEMGEAFVNKYLTQTQYRRFDILKDRAA